MKTWMDVLRDFHQVLGSMQPCYANNPCQSPNVRRPPPKYQENTKYHFFTKTVPTLSLK
jgi:hypothetical protein